MQCVNNRRVIGQESLGSRRKQPLRSRGRLLRLGEHLVCDLDSLANGQGVLGWTRRKRLRSAILVMISPPNLGSCFHHIRRGVRLRATPPSAIPQQVIES